MEYVQKSLNRVNDSFLRNSSISSSFVGSIVGLDSSIVVVALELALVLDSSMARRLAPHNNTVVELDNSMAEVVAVADNSSILAYSNSWTWIDVFDTLFFIFNLTFLFFVSDDIIKNLK